MYGGRRGLSANRDGYRAVLGQPRRHFARSLHGEGGPPGCRQAPRRHEKQWGAGGSRARRHFFARTASWAARRIPKDAFFGSGLGITQRSETSYFLPPPGRSNPCVLTKMQPKMASVHGRGGRSTHMVPVACPESTSGSWKSKCAQDDKKA